jgi:hypothetical protein
MTKLIEFFDQQLIKKDWRTQYLRYRLGRLKHQYWLMNRKHPNRAVIDSYDYSILQNCQPGTTVFFSSAGYYIQDIFPEVKVVEQHPVVKTFCPNVYICEDRNNLVDLPFCADNFAVVNNRSEMWTTVDGLTNHMTNYIKIMNPGCRVFYSFRDTQMHVNRLTTDMEALFLDWATSLEATHNLKLAWYDIDFEKKLPDQNGFYNLLENPDTTNGNLKFWFVYKGEPWTLI